MADNDVQLDLKKRARRRLVGAIAMALLAAIILPMVMDAEQKQGGNELQIRIPSQEGSNFASRMIAGAAPAPHAPLLPIQSAPLTPAVLQTIEAASSSSTSSQTVEPQISVSAPRQAIAKESSTSKAASSSKPLSEAQRAREILEGKPASREAGTSQFYVQLGVFRDEANAREVLTRASAAGVKVTSAKLEDKTRVRSGPYSERAGAETAVAKLKKAGLSSGIVTSK